MPQHIDFFAEEDNEFQVDFLDEDPQDSAIEELNVPSFEIPEIEDTSSEPPIDFLSDAEEPERSIGQKVFRSWWRSFGVAIGGATDVASTISKGTEFLTRLSLDIETSSAILLPAILTREIILGGAHVKDTVAKLQEEGFALEGVNEWLDQVGYDPENGYEEVVAGLGSLGLFVLLGLATGGTGAVAGGAASGGTAGISSAAGVAGASFGFTAGQIAGTVGASVSAGVGEALDAAIEDGTLSEREARKFLPLGIASGSVDGLAIGRVFNNAVKALGGKRILLSIFENMAVEGSTEGLQTYLVNVSSDSREDTAGIVRSMVVGGSVGGIAGGAVGVLGSAQIKTVKSLEQVETENRLKLHKPEITEGYTEFGVIEQEIEGVGFESDFNPLLPIPGNGVDGIIAAQQNLESTASKDRTQVFSIVDGVEPSQQVSAWNAIVGLDLTANALNKRIQRITKDPIVAAQVRNILRGHSIGALTRNLDLSTSGGAFSINDVNALVEAVSSATGQVIEGLKVGDPQTVTTQESQVEAIGTPPDTETVTVNPQAEFITSLNEILSLPTENVDFNAVLSEVNRIVNLDPDVSTQASSENILTEFAENGKSVVDLMKAEGFDQVLISNVENDIKLLEDIQSGVVDPLDLSSQEQGSLALNGALRIFLSQQRAEQYQNVQDNIVEVENRIAQRNSDEGLRRRQLKKQREDLNLLERLAIDRRKLRGFVTPKQVLSENMRQLGINVSRKVADGEINNDQGVEALNVVGGQIGMQWADLLGDIQDFNLTTADAMDVNFDSQIEAFQKVYPTNLANLESAIELVPKSGDSDAIVQKIFKGVPAGEGQDFLHPSEELGTPGAFERKSQIPLFRDRKHFGFWTTVEAVAEGYAVSKSEADEKTVRKSAVYAARSVFKNPIVIDLEGTQTHFAFLQSRSSDEVLADIKSLSSTLSEDFTAQETARYDYRMDRLERELKSAQSKERETLLNWTPESKYDGIIFINDLSKRHGNVFVPLKSDAVKFESNFRPVLEPREIVESYLQSVKDGFELSLAQRSINQDNIARTVEEKDAQTAAEIHRMILEGGENFRGSLVEKRLQEIFATVPPPLEAPGNGVRWLQYFDRAQQEGLLDPDEMHELVSSVISREKNPNTVEHVAMQAYSENIWREIDRLGETIRLTDDPQTMRDLEITRRDKIYFAAVIGGAIIQAGSSAGTILRYQGRVAVRKYAGHLIDAEEGIRVAKRRGDKKKAEKLQELVDKLRSGQDLEENTTKKAEEAWRKTYVNRMNEELKKIELQDPINVRIIGENINNFDDYLNISLFGINPEQIAKIGKLAVNLAKTGTANTVEAITGWINANKGLLGITGNINEKNVADGIAAEVSGAPSINQAKKLSSKNYIEKVAGRMVEAGSVLRENPDLVLKMSAKDKQKWIDSVGSLMYDISHTLDNAGFNNRDKRTLINELDNVQNLAGIVSQSENSPQAREQMIDAADNLAKIGRAIQFAIEKGTRIRAQRRVTNLKKNWKNLTAEDVQAENEAEGAVRPWTVEEVSQIVKNEKTTSEIKDQLGQIFFTNESAWWNPRNAARVLVHANNFMRTVFASGDIGVPFRQGIFHTLSDPLLTYTITKESFKAGKSDVFAFRMYEKHKALLGHTTALEDGVVLQDPFGSEALSERDEYAKSKLAERIPGIKFSNKLYLTFINSIRTSTALQFYALNPHANLELRTGIAKYINAITGRANIKEGTAETLGHILFAPRYALSKPDAFIRASKILANPQYNIATRKLVARHAASLAAYYATIAHTASLFGFAFGHDIDDPDFGKVVIGNTRLDFMGGYAQPTRTAVRILRQATESSGAADAVGLELNTGPGRAEPLQILLSFFQMRASPVVSLGYDITMQENIIGEPSSVVDWDWNNKVENPIWTRAQTFLMDDIVEAYKEYERVLPALGIGAVGMLGVGATTYDTSLPNPKNSELFKRLNYQHRNIIPPDDIEVSPNRKAVVNEAFEEDFAELIDHMRTTLDAQPDYVAREMLLKLRRQAAEQNEGLWYLGDWEIKDPLDIN